MKKLLSIAAVAALMTTGVQAGDVIVKAHVKNASVVTIGTTSPTALANDAETVTDYSMANFDQEVELGATTTTLFDENVNLMTNNDDTKIQMTLEYTNMSDEEGIGSNTIALKCEYDQGSSGAYAEKATNTPFDLADAAATDTNSNVVGKLKVTAIDADAKQVAGNYKGTIVATIASL